MAPSSLHPQKAFLGKDTVHGLTVCFVCLSVSSLDQGCDRVSSSWLLLSLGLCCTACTLAGCKVSPWLWSAGSEGWDPRVYEPAVLRRDAHTRLWGTQEPAVLVLHRPRLHSGNMPTVPPLAPGKSRHSLLRSKLRKRARRAATTCLRICLPTRRELLGDKPVSRASPCPPPRRLAGRLAPASARGLREQQTAAGLCVCVAVGPAVARGSRRPWTQSDAALRPS